MKFLKKKKPWDDMRSIRVYPEDHIEALRILADLWINYLKKDGWWHFFWEGDFFFVRYRSKYEKKIHNYLREKDITFSHYKDWKDDHKIVNEHKRYCASVFHANSLLMLETVGAYDGKEYDDYEDKLRDLGDRILHSFFNNQAYTIIGNGRDAEVVEMNVTAEISKFRSHYAGMRYWGYKVDKFMDDRDKYIKDLIAFYEDKYGEEYNEDLSSRPDKREISR